MKEFENILLTHQYFTRKCKELMTRLFRTYYQKMNIAITIPVTFSYSPYLPLSGIVFQWESFPAP